MGNENAMEVDSNEVKKLNDAVDHDMGESMDSTVAGVHKQKAEFVKLLGVAYDVENGVARELTTNIEALRKLHSFITEVPDEVFFDQDELKIKFDEIITECFAAVYVNNGVYVPGENEITLGRYFEYEPFDAVVSSHAGVLLRYVSRVFRSCRNFLSKNDIDEGTERNVLHFQNRLLCNYLLELRGYSATSDSQDMVVAAFSRALFLDELAHDFLQSLIDSASKLPASEAVIKEAFDPVLSRIRYCAQITTIFKPKFLKVAYKALNLLLAIKCGTTRPICNLLTSRSDFCPELLTELTGREFACRCYFGPFINKSVASVSGPDPNAPIERFYGLRDVKTNDDARFMAFTNWNNIISSCQIELHQMFYTILLNGNVCREAVLNFMEKIIKYNAGKTMIQVDMEKNIDDGFMINFASVMLHLSERITVDKVQPNYLFHSKCRLALNDETRMKFDSNEVEEFKKTLVFNDEDVKFQSECFFLTTQAIRLSLCAAIESFKRTKQEVKYMGEQLRRLQKRVEEIRQRNPMTVMQFQSRLEELKVEHKKMTYQLLALECMVKDESFNSAVVRFVTKQMDFLCKLVKPEYFVLTDLPQEAPNVFGMMPEFMVESVLDILMFLLKTNSKVVQEITSDFCRSLLVFLCNSQYFKSPFLMAKIVDVMFLSCSMGTETAHRIFANLIKNSYAEKHLFPSLVKFYSDIESTGASSEFYDKFNVRRSIQVIFQMLWRDYTYKSLMISTMRQNSKDFVRFINMIINDTIFLLDESLDGLRKIHEIETLFADEARVAQLTDEEKRAKQSVLDESSRSVRSWIILGNETMDMFALFSKDAPDAFCTEVLSDRIAEMLNNNIIKLCGPKCTELKVNDPKRFYYKPETMVGQIIMIYLNLNSERFAKSIAYDERSYTPEKFNAVLEKLKTMLSGIDYERFTNLCTLVKAKYEEKAQDEEDYGEDIPEEFQDPIYNTLMKDPVRAPSGYIYDRKVIHRHLLTTKNDPFTRQALTEDQLVEEPDLRERIQQWIKERKQLR